MSQSNQSDISKWKLKDQLAYLMGQLSMADEIVESIPGHSSDELEKAKVARDEIITRIEALAGIDQKLCLHCIGTGSVTSYQDGFPLACRKCRGKGWV